MSFFAKLFVDNKEIIVLDCSFEISKHADETGKPESGALGGQIEISFEMSENDDGFFSWAETLDMIKNGSIIFYKDNALAVKYRLEFTAAHCLNFSANFSSEGRFIANIILSAHELQFGNEKHTNHWGKL